MTGADETLQSAHPQLAAKARIVVDRITGEPLLLYPEGVLSLNTTARAILSLCDGKTSLAMIASQLASRYQSEPLVIEEAVMELLARLQPMLLVRGLPTLPRFDTDASVRVAGIGGAPRPIGLLAELTYRCPLRCPYCSNPTQLAGKRAELPTSDWVRAFGEAAELGVLHVHFSGGEPLAFPDLPQLVRAARADGMYTNLVTSGVGLSLEGAETLRAAGLDSIQISFQADETNLADAIAGAAVHRRKLAAAKLVRELGFPLTCNIVLHRANIHRVATMIGLVEQLGADRLELASAQYYGWANENLSVLLPTRRQIEIAEPIIRSAAARLQGKLEVLYVRPDYYGDRPKACMNGWGCRQLTINPYGDVLPCPTAGSIGSLTFDNVCDRPLAQIWNSSPAFTRFRGVAWMPEPCQSCSLRDVDFGGCRCQAALLTGDPANTDPACSLAPHRHKLIERIERSIEDFADDERSTELFEATAQYRTYPQ